MTGPDLGRGTRTRPSPLLAGSTIADALKLLLSVSAQRGHALSWPGWPRLAALAGPLLPGRLVAVTGPPGVGTTAFVLALAEGAALDRAPVLVVSLSLDVEEVLARLLVPRLGNPSHALVLLGDVPAAQVSEAAEALARDCPALFVWAPGVDERTGVALSERVRAVSQAGGDRAPLVIVDPVQSWESDSSDAHSWTRLRESLRQLARPRDGWPGACVVVAGQVPESGLDEGLRLVLRPSLDSGLTVDVTRNRLGGRGSVSFGLAPAAGRLWEE